MARSRYSSSSSSSTCFNSYYRYGYSSYEIAQYACVVVFTAVCLGTIIGLCVTRRKFGKGKHLVGLPYMFSLFFAFINWVIDFVWSTLSACDVGNLDYTVQYDMRIALLIFYDISLFLLLVVAFWTLNMMLRKQLGHTPAALKVALGIDLAVLGIILLPVIVLTSYGYYFIGRQDYRFYEANVTYILLAATYMGLAFKGVTIISVLGSGALSLIAGRSLKKKHMANTSLLIWIAVLAISIFTSSLISLITVAQQLTYYSSYSYAGNTAAYWIGSFFNALAFIAVIFIAKNPVWNSNSPPVEQHSHNAVEQPYSYDYQQPPTAYGGAGQHA